MPVNPDFHARRLPDALWRRSERTAGVEAVIQLHRLREVVSLAGFTRRVAPLWAACESGSATMVETLLGADSDPNVPLLFRETPLMTAGWAGSRS